jgi:hypothetical protein
VLVDPEPGGSARWHFDVFDVFGGRHFGAELKCGRFYPYRRHLLDQ